ncbi:MAG TPA: PhzF family phenazine biosynthesis protein [Candidatus Kapabacteria bacterium]|jgi:predicted PhzF superfamily epimerase YddE/YHI9
MPDTFFLANTFTKVPFEGGSAGVFVLREARDLDWMLGLTRAMNLTDAAFLIARSPNRFNMRYFAGFMETDFGIPGTLAAASLLYEHAMADPKRAIVFFSHGGAVSASRSASGGIECVFPQMPFEKIDPPEQILQGVDHQAEWVGKRGNDYIVQVASESRLRKITPEFRLLDSLGVHGLILTSVPSKAHEYDFIYRTFQPNPKHWPDAPIASTALLSLAPFWLKTLGKPKLKGFRSGPRGRAIATEVDADRIKVFGEAVAVLRGDVAAKEQTEGKARK